MARRLKQPAYLKLRRAVDRDLVERHKPLSPLLPIFALAFIGIATSGGVRGVSFAIAIPVALAWYAFVFWRAYRLMKIFRERGDRNYDERTKFLLPPEYAATESAAAARRRRRRASYRKP